MTHIVFLDLHIYLIISQVAYIQIYLYLCYNTIIFENLNR